MNCEGAVNQRGSCPACTVCRPIPERAAEVSQLATDRGEEIEELVN
jgi:hypothetical protein